MEQTSTSSLNFNWLNGQWQRHTYGICRNAVHRKQTNFRQITELSVMSRHI